MPQATVPNVQPQRPGPPKPQMPAGVSPPSAEPFGKPGSAAHIESMVEGLASSTQTTAAAGVRPRGKNGEARGWVAIPAARIVERDGEAAQAGRARGRAAAKRSPAQVVESLNSLSIDIARAIDHEASVELWDRYKRGERNVFTRRLYTLQGQKTFDELRKKYERDGDFRKAVDNYIGDFERLLCQVSKDDSDPTVSRMYLTSDTGKVYTMLAHAAGTAGVSAREPTPIGADACGAAG